MIRTTRWAPDTCNCVIDYTWDDAIALSLRVLSPGATVVKCPLHAAVADLLATLTEESARRQRVFGRLIAQFPALLQTDAEGNVWFKVGAMVATWLPDRTLQVSLPTLTTAQRTTAQTWCASNLGAGKVQIA